MIKRESPRFTSSAFGETAAAKLSNHSLAVDGRAVASFSSAFIMLASSSLLTSERRLDSGCGTCISFCAIN